MRMTLLRLRAALLLLSCSLSLAAAQPGGSPLANAAEQGDLTTVRALLKQPGDVNAQGWGWHARAALDRAPPGHPDCNAAAACRRRSESCQPAGLAAAASGNRQRRYEHGAHPAGCGCRSVIDRRHGRDLPDDGGAWRAPRYGAAPAREGCGSRPARARLPADGTHDGCARWQRFNRETVAGAWRRSGRPDSHRQHAGIPHAGVECRFEGRGHRARRLAGKGRTRSGAGREDAIAICRPGRSTRGGDAVA